MDHRPHRLLCLPPRFDTKFLLSLSKNICIMSICEANNLRNASSIWPINQPKIKHQVTCFSASNAFALYSIVINRPWSRVAPYFVGVLSGWLLYVMDGECAVSKVCSLLFFGCSVLSRRTSLTGHRLPVRIFNLNSLAPLGSNDSLNVISIVQQYLLFISITNFFVSHDV